MAGWPDISYLRTRVRDFLDESSASFFSDAQINRWLNDGERDVAIKGLCIENVYTKTTTANTRTIATPYCKIWGLEYVPASGDRRALQKITPLHFGNMSYVEAGNEPQAWCLWGKNACIEPIPQAAYTIHVYASTQPTYEMSDDTDEPQVPKAFIDLIVQYATIRGFYRDRKFAKAGDMYRSYILDLQAARDLITNKYVDMFGDALVPDAKTTEGQGGLEQLRKLLGGL